MIKVSVLYPRTEASYFDIDYYCNKHIPMVLAMFAEACNGASVEQAVESTSDTEQPFHAVGHLHFDSLEQFNEVFSSNQQAVMNDIPNYTNSQPVIQIGEVKIA